MANASFNGMSSGEIALVKSSRLHRSVVAVSVAATAIFALVLAKINPGVSTNATSGSSGSTSANSTSATIAPVPGSTNSAVAPANSAPATATGGS
ncbi:MAG: hypothetical protein M0Z45_02790 [Actinomycetota bacterium]|nr:hypothetical protein [Actinomycetota bacterium]